MSFNQKEYQKRYREKNREKLNAEAREYRKRDGMKLHVREQKLKYKYGIGLVEYNELFISQEGCCKICGIHQEQLKKPLFVDHCHTTGKVRGLLCTHCNVLLGMAKDNKDLMIKAIAYLEEA